MVEEHDDEGDESGSEDMVTSEVVEVAPDPSEPRERRFSLWRSRSRDKVDLTGLKDFVQVHVTLGGLKK